MCSVRQTGVSVKDDLRPENAGRLEEYLHMESGIYTSVLENLLVQDTFITEGIQCRDLYYGRR